MQEFRSVAISPDGKRVAWTKKIRDRKGAWKLGAVEVADGRVRRARRGGSPAPRTAARATSKSPVWSPDGKRIAFLSDAAKDGQAQLWVAPVGRGRRPPPDLRQGTARGPAVVARRPVDRVPLRRRVEPGDRAP